MTTALGVLLVGCGGGPSETPRTTTLGSIIGSNNSGTTPIPSTTSGGTGSIGGNSDLGNIQSDINNMGDKIDAIDANAKKAADKSSSNNKLLKWIGIVGGVALAGLVASKAIEAGRIKKANKELKDSGDPKYAELSTNYFNALGKSFTGRRASDIMSEAGYHKAKEAKTSADSAGETAVAARNAAELANENVKAGIGEARGQHTQQMGAHRGTQVLVQGNAAQLTDQAGLLGDMDQRIENIDKKLSVDVTKLLADMKGIIESLNKDGVPLKAAERTELMNQLQSKLDALATATTDKLTTMNTDNKKILQDEVASLKTEIGKLKTAPGNVSLDAIAAKLDSLIGAIWGRAPVVTPTAVVADASKTVSTPESPAASGSAIVSRPLRVSPTPPATETTEAVTLADAPAPQPANNSGK